MGCERWTTFCGKTFHRHCLNICEMMICRPICESPYASWIKGVNPVCFDIFMFPIWAIAPSHCSYILGHRPEPLLIFWAIAPSHRSHTFWAIAPGHCPYCLCLTVRAKLSILDTLRFEGV